MDDIPVAFGTQVSGEEAPSIVSDTNPLFRYLMLFCDTFELF